jgi:HD-GYP domain-containing protein (c-di-GMP phosphodiesterase class II)
MTSDRPYRRALSREMAVYEVRTSSGVQFCPDVADALLSLYQENKV